MNGVYGNGLQVIVSRHAIAQAALRFGRPRITWREIAEEVAEGMEHGRLRAHLPVGFGVLGRRKKAREGARYVECADGRRAYVVHKARSDRGDGRKVWIVMTALTSLARPEAA